MSFVLDELQKQWLELPMGGVAELGREVVQKEQLAKTFGPERDEWCWKATTLQLMTLIERINTDKPGEARL